MGNGLNLADIFKYVCLPLFLNMLHMFWLKLVPTPYVDVFFDELFRTATPPPPRQLSSPHLMHRSASVSHVVWLFRRWIAIAIASDFSGKHNFFLLSSAG